MRLMRIVAVALLMVSPSVTAQALNMYVIDVVGKSSLFVSPSGETLLIDAGVPATVDRIVEAYRALWREEGSTTWLSITMATMWEEFLRWRGAWRSEQPVDHGANVQMTPSTIKNVDAYVALTAKAKHIVVKAGDRIPIKGFDALVVMAAGQAIAEPLKSGDQSIPLAIRRPRKVWGRMRKES